MNSFKQSRMEKIILSSFILVIAGLAVTQGFVAVKTADAATVCAKAIVHVIARDQSGNFIPGIAYVISEPAVNSDGRTRPGKTVASGKIDAISGEGKSSFTPTGGSYVVKMYDKNANYGAFYFYNELTLACGEEKTFTETLSGLEIALRDAGGDLKLDTAYTISQQTLNANGQPVKQPGATVGKLNSDTIDQNIIYLADSGHTIDRLPVNYVISSSGSGGKEFTIYNISPEAGTTKIINFVFSDIKITFTDKSGINLPAGTKVEFLTQKFEAGGIAIPDKLIKTLTVNDYGYVLAEYPAGTYLFRIKKANGGYYNFPNITIMDQVRFSVSLTVRDSQTDQVTCAANSTVNVIARNAAGGYISGIKFELHERVVNANNLPAAGPILTKGVTDKLGNGLVSFKPNPAKAYILKMYDKNAAVGAFWFYDEIKFNCGETKTIAKYLSSISLTLRDTGGNLLENYGFSLYLQEKDLDNNIIKDKVYLVTSGKTSALGQTTVYVTSGDPINFQDTARYLISLKYNGLSFDRTDINLMAGADTQVDFASSTLNLTVVDANNNILAKSTKVDIYEQKQCPAKQKNCPENKKIFGKHLAALSLDDCGQAAAALPPGTYVLSLKDQAGQPMNFWDIKIQNGSVNSKTITIPLLRVYALDSTGKSLNPAAINIYSLTKNTEGGYQKNKSIYKITISNTKYKDIFLATGKYLVTVKQGTQEYGVTVDINNSSLKKIYIATKPVNLVKPDSEYKIATVNTGAAPAAGNSTALASALANRLKGYVLLQVESNGEAWYVRPQDEKRYYMQNGAASFNTMKILGVGVSQSDLSKISIGVLPIYGEADCDGDGLPDSLERAIGTQVCNSDSDGDGYSDGVEVLHNYNPLGAGKTIIDPKVADRLKGALLLPVGSDSQIWYVNPRDKKRYYIPDGNVGFKIMKYLSLGITNANLSLIQVGD